MAQEFCCTYMMVVRHCRIDIRKVYLYLDTTTASSKVHIRSSLHRMLVGSNFLFSTYKCECEWPSSRLGLWRHQRPPCASETSA
jgi:hypothetical protein